ncbi:electron transport complex subunit RsxC [Marinomonas pollencensis]|uniref:Ion-translocating oxidoreductase complex subunit C n=1 Tax=Marinomonas pollencensis TaxID=491954 RepID=A0A3E0DT82_9GAMM|nr:electron transport complex subunit RsxC [Marinomonas pollencensis]REG86606.1 electron transport complex protein RnfC [Marinomonas pollencensis]
MQTASVFSFHGGIHPPENKAQSLRLPLGRPSLPTELVLPLGQHIGQSSRPLVNVGDKVLKGQTIAINNGFLSSFLHAPTSGTIKAIEARPIAHPSGLSDSCIIITPDGEEQWTELSPLQDWNSLSKTDVLAYLAEMGIVGMGGAGFPTQVKLQGAHKHPLTHFIINAAECEPYITADDMLIREKTIELVLGIEALQHLVEAEQVIIGIEDNKPTAIAALNKVLSERMSNIQVAVVPTKYPSGGEKQLIQLLTGQEVPSGQYPADIGVLCQNVGTCVAVHDAIFLGKPLISRFTTLTGDALKAPQNVEVLLGTPINHLLDYAENDNKKLKRLVMGGPMMGFTLDSANVPIVKTSNCVLAASKKELPQPAPEQACIRCGMCEQACPASLLPQQLLWFSKSQELEKAEHYNLFDCIECGACSYVCPSSIPLVQYYRHTKSSIREAREAAVKSDLAKQRFEARKARQEAEAAEKEAKRIARQKASASKTGETKKAAPKAAPAATPSANDDAKKLKVDLAIAKTKLKKLQKQLLEAQENEHTEEINTLQLQTNEQEKALALLEEQLAKANAAAPAEAPKAPANEELKKAKVDVALSGTKLKKAQKQLADAPDDAELQKKVAGFEKELADAQTRLNTLSSAAPSAAAPKAAVSDELKKAKVDVALSGTKLKKAQKQLADAPDDAELQKKVAGFEKELADAQTRLNTLSSAAPSAAAPKAAVSDELKKAKVDVALLGVKLKKAQKQLAEAPEDSDLQSKVASFEKELGEAQARLTQMTPQSAAPQAAANGNSEDALKKLKIDTAIAKAAVKKVEKALKKAEDLNSPELETIRQQLEEAKKRAEELEKALANPSAGATTAATNEVAQPQPTSGDKQRKIDLAIAKAAVKKAEKGILALQQQGQDQAQIDASGLPAKLAAAQAKLADLEGMTNSVNVEPVVNKPAATESASQAEQIKQQKIAAALAKAQINKLTKRLADSPQDADNIQQEINAAKQKQQEAETQLTELQLAQRTPSQDNTQENR